MNIHQDRRWGLAITSFGVGLFSAFILEELRGGSYKMVGIDIILVSSLVLHYLWRVSGSKDGS